MSEIIASTYELLEKIGAGGGGNVYLANHLRLNKKVVLKADKRKITAKPELLRREVDVLKDLSHEYIPQVYDFFAVDETVYTVMDFIQGESLDKPLKRGERIPQAQVVKWAIQLLEALCYLHSPTHGTPPRGFVHSDIKPANMMLRPNGDICLIDFNIALAIGEENVVGGSAGYASPEHYGLDFSFGGGTVTKGGSHVTELMGENTETVAMPAQSSSSTSRKLIVPDARSDIYSTGATLYHLLSGKKPAKDATAVEPLSGKGFSPQIVQIITKAMNPNPDLRYQTAEEMLAAFLSLWKNDPRTKRLKRNGIISMALSGCLILGGGLTAFVGLKQMERTQNAYALAEYSADALRAGDAAMAIDYALQALPEKRSLLDPPYTAQARKALTDALGVYDLTDGFKAHRAIALESAPLKLVQSPDGGKTAVITQGKLSVFDTYSGILQAELSADPSALSDVVFRGEDVLIYAGDGAIRAYSLTQKAQLWEGKPATGISLSADGTVVAAVYKEENFATVYNAEDGTEKATVKFGAKKQSVASNDLFADPEDNLFALSGDGRWLAVSFADGGVTIFDLKNRKDDILLYETSDYTRFAGGFCGSQLGLITDKENFSAFTVYDLATLELLGGFESTVPFRTQVTEQGIYVATENVLVKIDPVTGEQTEVAYTAADIEHFALGDTYTLVATKDGTFSFFDKNAKLLETHESQQRCDFIAMTDDLAVLASHDAPEVRVMALEEYEETRLFTYDISYHHDEARISADGKTVMLFAYNSFRLYAMDGTQLCEVALPDAENIHDQQYRRDETGSYLEVFWRDGTVRCYSAVDGSVLSERKGDVPDKSLDEEFITERWKITAPLHGTPTVCELETGKELAELETEDYLTYVTQVGEYVITEYTTAQGERYGLILDEQCGTLARLDGLCDILPDGTLVLDDMRGDLRQTRIYSIQELITLAKTERSNEE